MEWLMRPWFVVLGFLIAACSDEGIVSTNGLIKDPDPTGLGDSDPTSPDSLDTADTDSPATEPDPWLDITPIEPGVPRPPDTDTDDDPSPGDSDTDTGGAEDTGGESDAPTDDSKDTGDTDDTGGPPDGGPGGTEDTGDTGTPGTDDVGGDDPDPSDTDPLEDTGDSGPGTDSDPSRDTDPVADSDPSSDSDPGTDTDPSGGTDPLDTWDTGVPPDITTGRGICPRAARIPGYLDQFQTPGDRKVVFCHRASTGKWVLVNTSVSACISHAGHLLDKYPRTLCDN